MRTGGRAMIGGLLVVAAGACGAAPEVGSIGRPSATPATTGEAEAGAVPSGALFSARLDQTLDTFYTPRGSSFTARVLNPLSGPDGSVLVRDGARVYGTLVSAGSTDAPRIVVSLNAIETVGGPAPLAATLRSAQHVDWIGPPRPGAEAGVGEADGRATQIHVPRGGLLELQLTEPLRLPEPALRR